mgnify:CR=1 FL=1|tara:strand:- start:859 stop:1758 length:900 start_codon:yes stop_codon:yes gene_type:complete
MIKPNIAIIYNFNDKQHHLGGSSFGIKNEISYVEQFLISINSIKENWNTDLFTYNFYVIHSEPFSQTIKNKIENNGANLIYVNYKKETYLRTFCFTEEIDCDYRLVLDNDTFALKTPNFDFTKDILGGFGGCKYNKNIADDLCYALSIKIPNSTPIVKNNYMEFNGNEYNEYYNGVSYTNIFPYFNCGALLIKNSISIQFGNLLVKSIELAKEWANKNKYNIWLQDFYGICVNHITNNWGIFETGFNFIINTDLIGVNNVMKNYKGNISLIHYINCDKNSVYGKLITSQKQKLNNVINS